MRATRILLALLFTLASACAPPAEAPAPGASPSESVGPPPPGAGFFSPMPVGAPYFVADLLPGPGSGGAGRITEVDGGALFFANVGFGGPPVLFRTDGTPQGTTEVTPAVSDYSVELAMGPLMFFTGHSPNAYDWALWRTDGTAAGTFKLKPRDAGITATAIGKSGGRAFLAAADQAHGLELWVTDGTVAGTRMVADLNPGPAYSSPQRLVDLGGIGLFSARDDAHGVELWKTDGTAQGTVRVVDLNPGQASSDPKPFGVLNGVLLFSATRPDTGTELWRTDGTPAGTSLVADLNAGSASSVLAPMGVMGGVLYFASGDAAWMGVHLWKTDGTAAGTTRVKVVDPPVQRFEAPRETAVTRDRLFFTLYRSGYPNGPVLWTSDGTEAGTRPQEGAVPGKGPISVYSLTASSGGWLYFSAADPYERKAWLWRTNGDPAETVPVETVPTHDGVGGLTMAHGRLLYSGYDRYHGGELWAVCLSACQPRQPPTITCPATQRIEARSAAGATVTYPLAVATVNGERTEQVQYSVPRGSVFPLGTTAVTATVADPEGGSASCSFDVVVRDTLPPDLTCPARIQLEADGSSAELRYPEVEARDLVGPVTLQYDPPQGTRLPVGVSTARITAADGAGNQSRCDLLVEVTRATGGGGGGGGCGCGAGGGGGGGAGSLGALLGLWLWRRRIAFARARVGRPGGSTGRTARILFALLFTGVAACARPAEAPEPEAPRAGFVAPPPAGVPFLLVDTWLGSESGSPSLIVGGGSEAYFNSSGLPGKLWRTDGTRAGTRSLGTVVMNGQAAKLGPLMVFDGRDAATLEYAGLYRTDGTREGTFLLSGRAQRPLGTAGGRFFVQGSDGEHGYELWTTDGTVDGLRLVADLNPGPGNSIPGPMMAVGETAFFVAQDDARGRELWKSDGTAAGTQRLTDHNPGNANIAPQLLAPLENVLLFTLLHPNAGRTLWRTDGTPGGTFEVLRLHGDVAATQIAPMGVMGGTLFLATSNAAGSGLEVWTTDGTAAGTRRVTSISSGGTFGAPRAYAVGNGQVVFFDQGWALWRTDGTAAGTYRLNLTMPNVGVGTQTLMPYEGWFYAIARGPSDSQSRLWKTDGTQANTAPVESVPSHWDLAWLTFTNDRLVYQGVENEHGRELWGLCLTGCQPEPPSLACASPAPFYEAQGAAGSTVNYPLAMVLSEDPSPPPIQYSVPRGSLFPMGTTRVTATTQDSIGSASCSFDIVVRDATRPSLACPRKIELTTDGSSAEMRYTGVAAWDLVGVTSLTYNPLEGTPMLLGTSSANVTAWDAAGNRTVCLITVIVTNHPADGGSGELDGGSGEPDGGSGEPDGGSGASDAGVGGPDAGEPDAGVGGPDAGVGESPPNGCGCGASGGGGAVSLGMLLGLWLLRRRTAFRARPGSGRVGPPGVDAGRPRDPPS